MILLLLIIPAIGLFTAIIITIVKIIGLPFGLFGSILDNSLGLSRKHRRRQ